MRGCCQERGPLRTDDGPSGASPAPHPLPAAERGRDRRHPPRRLGRAPRAGCIAALYPPGAARPADRHLAAAVPGLVGDRAGGGKLAGLAPDRPFRCRRGGNARRRLHVQRHRRSRFRRARRAHPHAADTERRRRCSPGRRVHGFSAGDRRRRSLQPGADGDPARRGGSPARRDLPLHEAGHLLADQDKEDDVLIGVKSSALALGSATRPALFAFYAAAIALWAAAALAADLAAPIWPALGLAALHLAWQAAALRIDDPADCLAKFRTNRWTGWLVLIGIVAARIAA